MRSGMGVLKPCPFCGGEASIRRGERSSHVSVECDGCWASTPWCDVDSAIAKWNRRAPIVSESEAHQGPSR